MCGPLRRFSLASTLIAAVALSAAMASTAACAATDPDRPVLVMNVEGAIGVGTRLFLDEALEAARRRDARLLVIRLDTPGGLVTATREVIRSILASPVPIALYVAPGGARAASAGTYIAYASHVSAMAPGTHIGAATPIQMSAPGLPAPGRPQQQPKDENKPGEEQPVNTAERKIVNDAVSYIKTLAELRGRNAEWAEKAVREAATLTAAEAHKLGVVDVIATDLTDLLSQLHGRTVETSGGSRELDVRNAVVVPIEPGWKTQLITAVTDPNVAFILLMIGIYGIIFEFWSPGLAGPGIIGAVALLVALMALSTLPVSFAGASLLVLGLILMAAEALAPGFGILGIGGAVAFVLGAVFLFDPSGADFDLAVAWPVIISAALTSALLLIGLLGFIIRARHRKVTTGSEQLIGMEGEVVSWAAGGGRVRVHGETWTAFSNEQLLPGTRVVVLERRGLNLHVAPLKERS